ncbi:MAG: CPBP family intramembrane metalloprotease [Flavobacteriales bacterium]|nr:CPBP family intramembrane metalloprotease [Flavobacteriales bacterium]
MVSHLPDENSTVIKQFEQITSIDMKSYFQEMENMFREVYAYFDNYPISAFLTVGIIAPILEELLFRGIILQGLLNKGKSPFLAIFISSLLFGLIHLNPWQLVGAFILGSAIGFVYYRTQSILTAILLHIINNSSVGILYYFYNEESFSEIFNVSNFIILAFGILFIVTFGTLLLKNTKQITLIK